jgi:hypothetical protein
VLPLEEWWPGVAVRGETTHAQLWRRDIEHNDLVGVVGEHDLEITFVHGPRPTMDEILDSSDLFSFGHASIVNCPDSRPGPFPQRVHSSAAAECARLQPAARRPITSIKPHSWSDAFRPLTRFASQRIIELTDAGTSGVFIMSEYDLKTGGRYRNTEFMTVRHGKIVEPGSSSADRRRGTGLPNV